MSNFSGISFGAVLTLSLVTACASTPPTNTLLTGIDSSAVTKTADTTNIARTASDPVCQQFYANAVDFSKQAAKPNPGGQILAATGISVLASVVTGGLFSGIGSTTGQIAAQTATNQLVYTGSNAALSGLNGANSADKKIIDMAQSLGCPVNTV